jgi:transcriptional regulator with XRE-family HTH domain
MQIVGTIPTFTLADRLKKAREVTGLEQGEFAERAGMARTTVLNYERGHTTPRAIYLRAWAEVSGVDLHWLETGMAPSEDEADISSRLRESNSRPSHYNADEAGFWELAS